MAEKLATKGITTFDQLAVLAPETMAAIDDELGFRGASARNDWVGQAKALVAERG
ncbi:50S ribosomal protein L21 [compost metagenome]